MTTFHYQAFDASGKTRRGLVEAADPRQARKKLAARELFAERLEPAGNVRRKIFGGHNLSPDARATVYRELGAALRAGITLERALDMLIETPETGRASVCLAAARDKIKDGVSTAAAFADALPGIRGHEIALIEAGEKTATLDSSLDKLADFLDEQVKTRASVISVMLYPAFILALGVVIATGLLGFAVPRITRLLQESGQTALPPLTRAVSAFGAAAARWGPVLILAAVAALLWFRDRARKNPSLSMEFDRLLFRLPLYGRGYALLARLRFCRALAVLLAGGTPAVEAMLLAGKATGSRWLESEIARQAEAVRHGEAISQALRRIPPFSVDLCNWVEMGEAAGTLPRMLENAAQRFRGKWEIFVARAHALLEPVLILAVGGFVFIIVLATLLPIISLNSAALP